MKYCISCLEPDTRPRTKFNSKGLCSACSYKKDHINLSEKSRIELLKKILIKFKSHKKYDCIIGVSGGKDSTRQALWLRDKFKINPYNKLLLIVLLSIFVLSINKNLVVENFSLSFYDDRIFLNNFSFFFTIFCILILLNALNFYDGVNGQSGIFYIFIFSFLYYVSHFHDFYLYLILILLFILILNLKNKLFFGDSGIYLISSILVISLIYEYNITKNILYADEIFFLFLLPGFDLIRLTFQRIVLKKNILFGDRNHLHHLLVKKGSLINANIILFGLSAFPILAFSYIKSNFYLILVIFLILYFSLLLILDKKHIKKI